MAMTDKFLLVCAREAALKRNLEFLNLVVSFVCCLGNHIKLSIITSGAQKISLCWRLLLLAAYAVSKSKKSNLHYARGITPKRVTNGGANFRCLAPGLHSLKKRRSVGDTVPI